MGSPTKTENRHQQREKFFPFSASFFFNFSFFFCLVHVAFSRDIFVWTSSGGTMPTPHLIQSIGTQCDLVEAITMTVMSFCPLDAGNRKNCRLQGNESLRCDPRKGNNQNQLNCKLNDWREKRLEPLLLLWENH